MIYRLDAGKEPYAFDGVPVEKSVRQGSVSYGRYLCGRTYAGMLDIRDGGTGEVLHRGKGSFPKALI